MPRTCGLRYESHDWLRRSSTSTLETSRALITRALKVRDGSTTMLVTLLGRQNTKISLSSKPLTVENLTFPHVLLLSQLWYHIREAALVYNVEHSNIHIKEYLDMKAKGNVSTVDNHILPPMTVLTSLCELWCWQRMKPFWMVTYLLCKLWSSLVEKDGFERAAMIRNILF